MTNDLEKLLTDYVAKIASIYESHLKKVILYGSYARGDYNEFSDIDIMILVDMDNKEIESNDETLFNVTFDISFDNQVTISPFVQNIDHFNKWIRSYPFYNNINNEGVELYDAA